jgi:flagellar biosynthesis/type III secretory pathway chaperone
MSEQTPVTDLIAVTDRFIPVLEREVELLRATDTGELQTLQKDKAVLAAAYESQIRTIGKSPQLLDSLSADLRHRFKSATETFRVALAKNERALKAAKEVNYRVLQAIAHEVENQRQQNTAYTADGSIKPASKAKSREPISVAVDQRL